MTARLYPTVTAFGDANEKLIRQMVLGLMGLAPMPIRQRLIHGVDALGTLRTEAAVLGCPRRGSRGAVRAPMTSDAAVTTGEAS